MRYVIYRHTRALDLTPDVATQIDAERYATAMYGVGIWCWQADAVGADAWREHYDEMAKKTAIRRLAKRIPQSAELADALGVEDDDAAPLPKGEVRIVEPETPAALMPGRETALQDRARTVSSAEYGGSSDDAPLSPDAMLAAEDPYAEQDDRWIAAQDGELALGETRARSRTAQEEGR